MKIVCLLNMIITVICMQAKNLAFKVFFIGLISESSKACHFLLKVKIRIFHELHLGPFLQTS